jgi:hypothetical protein
VRTRAPARSGPSQRALVLAHSLRHAGLLTEVEAAQFQDVVLAANAQVITVVGGALVAASATLGPSGAPMTQEALVDLAETVRVITACRGVM